jgi:hypothetical protein
VATSAKVMEKIHRARENLRAIKICLSGPPKKRKGPLKKVKGFVVRDLSLNL